MHDPFIRVPGISSPETSAAHDSSIMAAWPSHPASPSKPHQKATASNNRPMDEEDGQWIFRAIIASRTSRFRTGSPSPDAYQAPPYATAPSDGPGNRRTGKVPEPLRPHRAEETA
ncbi:hypothetical protein M5E88_12570 [Akkermansia muciniphila]|nr:hypothetical protein M5E88_12570 [Akkermansia muciniphila]